MRAEEGYLRAEEGYLRAEEGYLRAEEGYLRAEGACLSVAGGPSSKEPFIEVILTVSPRANPLGPNACYRVRFCEVGGSGLVEMG